MTAELEERTAAAVHSLTETRTEAVTAYDEGGAFLGVHTVTHAPLLLMLEEGTGNSSGKGGNGSGLPIDADALMMLAEVRRTLTEWSKWIIFINGPTSIDALTNWHAVHVNSVRDGHLSDEGERIAAETVERWVAMIERKFDPDEIREWNHPCYSCGARRIVVDDEERFAIRVNVTQQYAECSSCGKQWVGLDGLKELRYFTNLLADAPKETVAQNVADGGDVPLESAARGHKCAQI